jgi:type III pantothenate kinase
MLLAVDIGNSHIVLGIFADETLIANWRLTTRADRTADELWVLVSHLFDDSHIDIRQIGGVALSSVVPPLTDTVAEMVQRGLGHDTLRVDTSNAGIAIHYENPAEVGADRLVNAVAAHSRYGRPGRPVIVVDFGTATTFDAISSAGEYLGGAICPGVEISADALFQRAARLPRVEVRKPPRLIGRTTVESMQAGLFYGYLAMLEGIVERMRTELSSEERAVCIATGGLATSVTAETSVIDHVDADLTLTGLRLVWARNQSDSPRTIDDE